MIADYGVMPPSPLIKGKLVTLRPLEADDLSSMARWRNAAFAWLFGSHYVAESGQADWFRRYQGDPGQLMFTIQVEGQAVGCIGLADIDRDHDRAEIGRLMVDAAHQGHGYGTDAVRALADYAFTDLGLHRLYLYVLASNAAAIKLYHAAGFACEGTLREHVWKHGAFRDVLLMARLVGEVAE
jgi:UDP-4-amino-4,6-dideoxy-N-acetyl-beta-L-altrosamine N-acetyltransferase